MADSRPIRVGVCGATGYLGQTCVGLLSRHPEVELVAVSARNSAGQPFNEVVKNSRVTLPIQSEIPTADVDVIFASLPHTVAAASAVEWRLNGVTVIDMSADFRLKDPQQYRHWYGTDHPAPGLCQDSTYALVEFSRDALMDCDLIAVPGCYPTAALIGALPAVNAGFAGRDVIIDAKSGVSGAGRSPSLTSHFPEVNESVHAYSAEGHRHKSELEQELGKGERDFCITFVPHLIPITRGLLATVYVQPTPGISVSQIRDVYRTLAEVNPFILYSAEPPRTKSVAHTNFAAVNVAEQGDTAIVTVAIDNLIKGGAGQAVQAFNVRFGFDETTGLPMNTQWP